MLKFARGVAALVALSLATGAVAARAETIELICRGDAFHTEATQTYATASDHKGHDVSGSATTYEKSRTGETLRVRFDGEGGGKLKLPASLIPPISRGKDGWWDFVSLEMGDDLIRGQILLNYLNKPKILLDRRTGDIDIKGLAMKFQGVCEKASNAAERKF